MEIVINAMSSSVHNLRAKIQRLIKWEKNVHGVETHGGELRRHRSVDAYQLCLMEQNTICNQHLPLRFHCICHVVPHLKHVCLLL